jgi:hypothetical protein
MVEPLASFTLECESQEPDLSAPRTCRLVALLRAADRDDYWLAEVDPPFIGQHLRSGADDIADIVLATRFKGFSLFWSQGREDNNMCSADSRQQPDRDADAEA